MSDLWSPGIASCRVGKSCRVFYTVYKLSVDSCCCSINDRRGGAVLCSCCRIMQSSDANASAPGCREDEKRLASGTGKERHVETSLSDRASKRKTARLAMSLAVELNRNTPRSTRAVRSIVDPVDSEPPSSEEEEEERKNCEGVRRVKKRDDMPDQFDFMSAEIEASEYPFQPEGSPPAQMQPSGASLQGVVEETVEEETFERDAAGASYLVKRTRTVRRVVAGSAVAAVPVLKGAAESVGDGGSAAGMKSVAGNKRKRAGGKKKASSPRPSRTGGFSGGDFLRFSDRSRKSVRESVKDLSCSGETSEDESAGEEVSSAAPSTMVGVSDDNTLAAVRALLSLGGGGE